MIWPFYVVFLISEQQELVRQIEETHYGEQKQDLHRELERLVKKMEEKGAQITKLRKHQQTVRACATAQHNRVMVLKGWVSNKMSSHNSIM